MKQKEAIQLGITGILVVILLMATVRAMGKRKKHPKPPPGADAASSSVLPTAAGGSASKKQAAAPSTPKPAAQSSKEFYAALEKETATMDLARDPFSKQSITASTAAMPKGKTSSLQLNGIAWDEQHPTAIINNEITEVGSQVDEYPVVDIKKDRVILSDGERNLILTIGL